jgi:hypothetical protein
MTTCTIPRATTGPCGKPAVLTFKSRRDGRLFHECVEHAQHGQHLLTCELPLPLCQICGSEFGLTFTPPETPHPYGGTW